MRIVRLVDVAPDDPRWPKTIRTERHMNKAQRKVRVCDKCNGCGSMVCPECDGLGEDDDGTCSVCLGSGIEICDSCDGSGDPQ